jgi:hypothetical protein
VEAVVCKAVALITLNEQVTLFPETSVASYVINVVLLFANVDPDDGPAVCVTDATEQLSDACGVDHVAVGVQADKIISAGQLITGFSTSVTVTSNEEVIELP